MNCMTSESKWRALLTLAKGWGKTCLVYMLVFSLWTFTSVSTIICNDHPPTLHSAVCAPLTPNPFHSSAFYVTNKLRSFQTSVKTGLGDCFALIHRISFMFSFYMLLVLNLEAGTLIFKNPPIHLDIQSASYIWGCLTILIPWSAYGLSK